MSFRPFTMVLMAAVMLLVASENMSAFGQQKTDSPRTPPVAMPGAPAGMPSPQISQGTTGIYHSGCGDCWSGYPHHHHSYCGDVWHSGCSQPSLQPIWKTKQVEVICHEHIWVEEPFKYTICVPTLVKQKVKCCEVVATPVPYKYWCCELVKVKETVKCREYVWTEVDEPYTWCEPVISIVKQKKLICETVCVPYCIPCFVPYSPCGNPCQNSVVMKPTVITREIECDVTICTSVLRHGVRKCKVCTPIIVEREIECCKYVQVEKEGIKIVYVPVVVEKEIDCYISVPIEKDGIRKVCRTVTVKKIVDQPYCDWVVCSTPCPDYCPTPCPSHHHCNPYPDYCHNQYFGAGSVGTATTSYAPSMVGGCGTGAAPASYAPGVTGSCGVGATPARAGLFGGKLGGGFCKKCK